MKERKEPPHPTLSPSGEGQTASAASEGPPRITEREPKFGLPASAAPGSVIAAPALALSIRQPWAWLILHGFKDIENRPWATNYRGRFLIHASGAMQWSEYAAGKGFVEAIRLQLPAEWRALRWFPEFQDLERGGIVGEAELVDCVTSDPSPWFVGPFGFVLQNVKKLPFVSTPGALKFFDPEKIKGKQLGLGI